MNKPVLLQLLVQLTNSVNWSEYKHYCYQCVFCGNFGDTLDAIVHELGCVIPAAQAALAQLEEEKLREAELKKLEAWYKATEGQR